MGYLSHGSGIRGNSFAIQGQIYNFFTFVFFSGYLKIAAGNFSDAGVLTGALKM